MVRRRKGGAMAQKTVEELEGEISEAETHLADLQSQREAAVRKRNDFMTLRSAKSDAWLNHHDKDAKKWLDSAGKELFQSQYDIENYDFAINKTVERIEELYAEKQAAIRADVERRISEEEAAMLDDAVALDDGVARLIIARDAVFARRD